MEYEKFKLKRIDGFDLIKNAKDAEVFLNEIFVKGDLYLTINDNYTVLFRKDEEGNLSGYKKEAGVHDDSVEYEEMTMEQCVRMVNRMKSMFNKKLFRKNLYQ